MWEISDHVCRVCFGRVLIGMDKHKGQARCADCGTTGKTVKDVCACGVKLMIGVNAGLRCVINPNADNIENPAQVVVRYVGHVGQVKHGIKRLKDFGDSFFEPLTEIENDHYA